MTAIIMNLVAITLVVAGWTAAVWAFYTHLDDSPAKPRTARGNDATGTQPADSRPATRKDVSRAA